MKQDSLRVGVVGCGAVGAAIAYELSQVPGLAVTVLDRRAPDTWEATGAALGVMMAVISRKKGRSFHLRLASLKRYDTLIPELEAITGHAIPFNRQGLLQLCFEQAELGRWRDAAQRATQELPLEILTPGAIATHYPQVAAAKALETNEPAVGAVYSPSDRQVNPIALTQALIEAARRQGAVFHFQTTVDGFTTDDQHVEQIQTSAGALSVDWLVLAAGLGTTPLSQELQQPIEVRPVLGQALQLQLRQPLAAPGPVITGLDVHLVPVNQTEVWVGATVEFPAREQHVQADARQLETLRQQAIALCPALSEATVTRSWSGLRPRPQERVAPVVEPLTGYRNVLLATGHYRNGILLAPITAQKIRELICGPC